MNNIEEILLSELVQARSYIERILHAITDLSQAFHRPEIRKSSSNMTENLEELIKEKFLPVQYQSQTMIHREHLKTAKQNVKSLFTYIEAVLKLSLDKKLIVNDVAEVINCAYKHAKILHDLLQKYANLDVQPPRIGFIKIINTDSAPIKPTIVSEVKNFGRFSLIEGGLQEDEFDDFEEEEEDNSPKLYQFDLDKFNFSVAQSENSLLGLEAKREEKYEHFLTLGHKAAFQKKNDEALELFLKAKSFKETAEINTLCAWIYTLLNQAEKAKNLLLKAISIDPDYGPPYNDLGSILLNESNFEEAVKWFELAKKAPKYQNREYPYINAGRAYMMIHNYQKAISEFEEALTICPENDELFVTVEKIKKSLNKEDNSSNPEFN